MMTFAVAALDDTDDDDDTEAKGEGEGVVERGVKAARGETSTDKAFSA